MSASLLLHRAPEAVLCLHHDRAVTAATFLTEALALSTQLPACRQVINLCQDRYSFSLGLAAALAAGRTTLLPPNRLPASVTALREAWPDSLVIGDTECVKAWTPHQVIEPAPRAPAPRADMPAMPEIDADLDAVVVYTSGSTGECKAIHKPWRTLADSSRLNARELGVDKRPVQLLATVPPQHMYGLETSVLLPWFAPVTVSSAQPFFPQDVANELARLSAPRILVSTPVHLRALLHCAPSLPPLAGIWSATAPLCSDMARQLGRTYSCDITEIFGSSETGCLARRDPAADAPWQTFSAFSLRQLGDQCRAAADHLPGPVSLQDRLAFEPDGRFRLVGRDTDLVNIAGKRASLAQINRQLLAIPGVLDGVVFQPPESRNGRVSRLAALVVAPRLKPAAIRAALRDRLDEVFIPRPIRLVQELPRAETGKLALCAVLDLYRQAGARPA